MSIWHSPFSVEEVNQRSASCGTGHLGIELTEIGDDFLAGRMPVDQRTKQPAGVLHGGISLAFAETLGTCAAAHVVDRSKFHCVGQEINANHVRAVSEGWVYGVARPLHIGRTSQVWDIRISNEAGKLVCVSRITVAVLAKPSQY